MISKINLTIVLLSFCSVLYGQSLNEYPENGNAKLYQSAGLYRSLDIENFNTNVVSRFEATTDGTGQLWLKDASGNYKVIIRSNANPSSIAGELVIGEFSNVSKNVKLFVNGASHFTGRIVTESNLILKQEPGLYRSLDVKNLNDVLVSRFEATTDGSGQLWFANASGDRRISLKTNNYPSYIAGELIIGQSSSVSKNRKLYVEGSSELTGMTYHQSGLRFKNDGGLKGLLWSNSTWGNYLSRIDDYNGQLRFMTDDNIYFTDINVSNAEPGATAMYINVNNKAVGIGTDQTAGYKLAVNGNIGAKEIKVENNAAWPDYVFNQDYVLMPLEEVERKIKQNRHLEGIPSEDQVDKEGINLGEFSAKLLKKIEELTLYTIAQEKKIKRQAAELKELRTSQISLDLLNQRLMMLEKQLSE